MMEADLLIFDLDGTLVSSGGDIAASVNATLRRLGLPERPAGEILRFVGDGVRLLIERSLGGLDGGRFDEALEIFGAHYREHMLDTTRPYPGIEEALRHFAGKRKVILTNKRHAFARPIADALGLAEHFDEVIGADSTPYTKPDLRLLDLVTRRFGVLPGRTAVIGDGVNDVLLARNGGALSCAYLNGLTPRDSLLALNPDCTYEDPAELVTLLR
ncbi:MAG: HAD-IA family hydrolase [Syntrophaceae bacterium]|nr:HAD-IA family hydrolase [Syntrophaceae bacterium]